MDVESGDVRGDVRVDLTAVVEKKPKTLNSIKEQLEQCSRVLKAVQDLIKFIGTKDLRDSHSNSELELRVNLEDQLRLIDKPFFEVAVVGKEKAGKSMLLNGWLDFNLLPSKKERCTYTTIEIRSCVSSHDEKYCIEYLSKKEFEDILKEKYKLLKTEENNELLKKEIEEIEANKSRIEEYLGRAEIEKTISKSKDAEKELNSAITDPGHARAVKKINIYTSKLLEEDRVAFYDVPGYDSPITFHKELTKQKLAEVDAILFAKEFDKPSLNEAETEILDRSESYSKFIKTKDKVIVALTKCDSILTRAEYSKTLKSSQSSLQKYQIPESRIIPVCALAAFTEETAEVKAAKKRLADLKIEDGMGRLKEATKECVTQLRLTIANERCDSTKRKIEDLWNNVCAVIKSEYEVDFNSDIKETVEKEEMNKKFNEWFVLYWNDLQKSFQNFFIQKICPKSNVDMPTFQSEEDRAFKKAYQEIIEESFNEIGTLKTKRQRAIYEAEMSNQQVVDPMQGNIAIRMELAREAIDKLNKITMGLNELLWKKYDEIIDWIRANMWNMTEIRREMIGVDEKAEKFIMQSCFDALIQRLARPATEIFLRFPRSRIIRRKILEEYKLELIILDNFIEEGRIKPRGLVHFLASGEHREFKIDARIEAPEIIPTFSNSKDENKEKEEEEEKGDDEYDEVKVDESKTTKKDENDEKNPLVSDTESKPDETIEYQRDSQFDRLDYVNPAGCFEAINKEINEDANEYLECLKNSVFYGSGLLRFYKQELDRIRRKFIELEKDKRTWTQLVNKHWEENDSKIPAPNMVTIIKKKSSIVEILKDAQQLIDKFEY